MVRSYGAHARVCAKVLSSTLIAITATHGSSAFGQATNPPEESTSAPAQAASDTQTPQDTQGGGVRDIIVTAQKREQRLQDVPVAVSAVTADTLTGNRITNVRDLDAIAPNLTVRTVAAGASLPSYTIRGLSSLGSVIGSDKGVALYIDGVYLGAAVGSIFDLADLERIEVLRGPQGTLFGRNSTGGAISITTREPDGKFGGRQTFTYGNYDQFRSVTSISTPQIGPFSGIFSYTHNERRGDIRNLGAGTTFDYSQAFGGRPTIRRSPRYLGNDNAESFAAAVKLDASDDFKAIYRFDLTDDEYTTAGQGLVYVQPFLRDFFAAQPDPSVLTPVSKKRPKAVNNSFLLPSRTKNQGHSLTLVWEVSNDVTLKNIAAFRKNSVSALAQELSGAGGLIDDGTFGFPGAPLSIQVAGSFQRDRQWSNELQLNVDLQPVTVTTGLLYFRQKSSLSYGGNDSPGGLGPLTNPPFAAFPGFAVPNPFDPRQTGGGDTTITIRSLAAYAQAEFHLTDTIDIVGGIRVTKDKKTGTDFTIVSDAQPDAIFDVRYKKSKASYNIGVNYKPNQDVLLYAKRATGFISGTSLSNVSVAPETAESWEAGVKADLFDRVLRANLAVFAVEYGSLQATLAGLEIERPEVSSVLVNVGSARARGFELETTLAPNRNLTFTGAVGYTDFKYKRLSSIITANAAEILEAQRPTWTLNFSGQYESEPIAGDMTVLARLDANWKSKTFQAQSIPASIQALGPQEYNAFRDALTVDPYWIVNGRVALRGLSIAGTSAELALWGRNIFDNKSVSYGASLETLIPASYERARTYGADLTIRF